MTGGGEQFKGEREVLSVKGHSIDWQTLLFLLRVKFSSEQVLIHHRS